MKNYQALESVIKEQFKTISKKILTDENIRTSINGDLKILRYLVGEHDSTALFGLDPLFGLDTFLDLDSVLDHHEIDQQPPEISVATIKCLLTYFDKLGENSI